MAEPSPADFTRRLEDLQRQVDVILGAQHELNQHLQETSPPVTSSPAQAPDAILEEVLRITERMIDQVTLIQQMLQHEMAQALADLRSLQQHAVQHRERRQSEGDRPAADAETPVAPGAAEAVADELRQPVSPAVAEDQPAAEAASAHPAAPIPPDQVAPAPSPASRSPTTASSISSHLLRRIGRGVRAEAPGSSPPAQTQRIAWPQPTVGATDAGRTEQASTPRDAHGSEQHIGLIVFGPSRDQIVIRSGSDEVWELPKTRLIPGETAEQAARRILLVQLGITGQLGPVVGRLATAQHGQAVLVTYFLVYGEADWQAREGSATVSLREALAQLSNQDERSILAWTTQLKQARQGPGEQ